MNEMKCAAPATIEFCAANVRVATSVPIFYVRLATIYSFALAYNPNWMHTGGGGIDGRSSAA